MNGAVHTGIAIVAAGLMVTGGQFVYESKVGQRLEEHITVAQSAGAADALQEINWRIEDLQRQKREMRRTGAPQLDIEAIEAALDSARTRRQQLLDQLRG